MVSVVTRRRRLPRPMRRLLLEEFEVVVQPLVRFKRNGTWYIADGQICPERRVIRISCRLPLSERVLTLLHELVHAVHPWLDEAAVERRARWLRDHLVDEDLALLEAFCQGG